MTRDPILLRTQKKVLCKCGQLICFKYNHPCMCRKCGRKVYPSKKSEFMDKLKRKGVMTY